MQWSREKYGGFSKAEPWLPMSAECREEITVEAQEKDGDSILAFYQKLIAMRKKYPVIAEGEISFLETGTDLVMAYRRTLREQELLVFCNLGSAKQNIHWDKKWKEYTVMLGNYPLQAGACPSPEGMDCSASNDRERLEEASYTMKPYEFIVLGKNVAE